MVDLTWVSTSDPPRDAVEELRGRLAAYKMENSRIADGADLAVFVRDGAGELAGGVTGNAWGAVLEVDFLWVRADLRGRGVGQQILSKLEQEASLRGAKVSFLNTYSFQAPDFYRMQGYEVTEVIEGYPGGVEKIFLKKTLV